MVKTYIDVDDIPDPHMPPVYAAYQQAIERIIAGSPEPLSLREVRMILGKRELPNFTYQALNSSPHIEPQGVLRVVYAPRDYRAVPVKKLTKAEYIKNSMGAPADKTFPFAGVQGKVGY